MGLCSYSILHGLCGLFVIIPFLIANYFTEGEFFLHTVVYNANPFSIKMAIFRYRDMINSHIILFGFAAAYTIYTLSRREPKLLIMYFMISATFAFGVGKTGAVINYFLELIAVSCILTGALLDELEFRLDKKSLLNSMIIMLLLLQLVPFFQIPRSHWSRLGPDKTTAINNFNKISSYVKQSDNNILSQNASFVVLNGKTYLFQPFIFNVLQRQGLWHQSKLVNDIKDEKFSLLLLYFDVNDDISFNNHRTFFTDEMRDAIRQSYYIVEKIHGSHIYMPKSRHIKS
jgi:hypothetical protein